MRPFELSDMARSLTGQYPSAATFRDAWRGMRSGEREGAIHLWLSEGIPFAFQDLPMLFEAIRNWLANELALHAKAFTLIGSARIGYSMNPDHYGRAFGDQSDMDLVAVSADLFNGLSEDFFRWKDDVLAERVQPATDAERRFWPENLSRLPGNIRDGFIDPYKIASRPQYRAAVRLGDALWRVKAKLDHTPTAPKTRRISARVYRDWQAFSARLAFNMRHVFRSLRAKDT